MSDAARRIGEALRRHGHTESAELSDLVGEVDTRPHAEPGAPEPPLGLPDAADANQARMQAEAAEQTRAHFAGETPEQMSKRWLQQVMQGGGGDQ